MGVRIFAWKTKERGNKKLVSPTGSPWLVIAYQFFYFSQFFTAHRNIRAFVTQGGLQSIEEAVSRGVPLIGMPFMGDQPSNVQKIVDTGIGLGVDPSTVSKEELRQCIVNVAQNHKYLFLF